MKLTIPLVVMFCIGLVVLLLSPFGNAQQVSCVYSTSGYSEPISMLAMPLDKAIFVDTEVNNIFQKTESKRFRDKKVCKPLNLSYPVAVIFNQTALFPPNELVFPELVVNVPSAFIEAKRVLRI